LQARYALIGDVRGSGLFLGIDLVLDRETRQAAPFQASYVVNRLRDRGILAGTDGPHHNVISCDRRWYSPKPTRIFREDAGCHSARRRRATFALTCCRHCV